MNPYSTKVFEFNTKDAYDEQWKSFEHLLDQFDEDVLDDKEPEEQLNIIHSVIEETVKLSIPRKKDFEEEDDTYDKNPAYGRHRISQPMRIVAPPP